jgi:hypothetical protein
MSTPSYLATDFLKDTLLAIADVQSILDQLTTTLLTNLPVGSRWTQPVAGTYKSPPDAVGRFMRVVVSRISATRMQFKAEDQNLTTIIDGTLDLSALGNARIYAGTYHLAIETQVGATYEFGHASLVDPRPEALNVSASYVIGNTERNAAGAQHPATTRCPDAWFMQDSGGVVTRRRSGYLHGIDVTESQQDLKTTTGKEIVLPIPVAFANSALNKSFRAGMLFQCLWVDQSHNALDQISPPIDVGVIGIFEVMGRIKTNANNGSAKLAIRVG